MLYISFDYNAIKTYNYKIKENRVLAIDMNPNSIGWSVVDWYSENTYHFWEDPENKVEHCMPYRFSVNDL